MTDLLRFETKGKSNGKGNSRFPAGMTARKARAKAGLVLGVEFPGLDVEDGFFDFSGGPGLGGLDEGVEDGAGERAGVVGALGVPLDGDYEMIL